MTRKLILLQIALLAFAVCTSVSGVTEKSYATLVPDYDLSVRVLPEAQRIEVSGTVRLPAAKAQQEFIPLLLSAEMRDLRVEVLEPAESAGMAAVEAKGKGGGRVFYAVIPAKPLAANASVLLRFSYTGGEKGGFVFHLGAEGSFAHGGLSAWYPLFDAGGYTGHIGTLRFSVPAGYVAVATGRALSSVQEMAQGDYRFAVTQPSIFSFAASRYTIARRTDKPKLAVYLLHTRPDIDAYLEKCARVLDFLSREFGPYPFGEFSLVEIPTEKAAGFFGASSPGLIFIPSKFIDAKFDYSLHGHEFGHQWWGGTIGITGEKGGEMLSEGMAQFGSLLTVEKLEGEAAAQQFRQSGYPSIGNYNFTPCEGRNIPVQSLHGYLMLTTTGDDQRLDSLKGELAHSLATSKGFLVLDLLSRTIGREKFRRILTDFTRQHAFREVTWEDFLRAVEAGSGREMRWFYEQWFERTGAPVLSLSWKQEQNVVRGSITQTAPFYQVSVEVQVAGEQDNKQVIKPIELRGAQTDFTLPVDFKARTVILNPRVLVPAWTPEYQAEAEAIRQCAQK